MSGAQAMRVSAQHKMEDTVNASNRLEEEIMRTLNPDSVSIRHSATYANRKWWVPLLLRMESEKSFSSMLSLQSTIEQGKDAYHRFKSFTDIRGLILLVGIEFEELQTARQQALKSKSLNTDRIVSRSL